MKWWRRKVAEEWVCRECGSVNTLDSLRCACGYAGDVPQVDSVGPVGVRVIPHANDIEMQRRAAEIAKLPRGDKTPAQMAKELAAQWEGK